MATPDTVHFTLLDVEPALLLRRLDSPLSSLAVECEAVGRLGYETDDGSFGFTGHELECTSFTQAARQVEEWGSIAVKLLAPATGGRFYLYFWGAKPLTCSAMELQASNLYFESGPWDKLDWIRAMLPTVSATLGVAASAYDAHRGELFDVLELDVLLGRLRDGSAWASVPLWHYTVRHDAISAQEMRDLVRKFAPPRFRYSETTAGYHVLDNLF